MKKMILLLVLFPSLVYAQQTPQQLFESGMNAFRAADYPAAISHFEKAYRVAPRPILIYNISVSHGRLKNYAEATKHAELAQLQGLKTPEREKNQARLVAWKVRESATLFRPSVEKQPVAVAPDLVKEQQPTKSRVGWFYAGFGALLVSAGSGVAWFIFENQIADAVARFESARTANDPVRANQVLSEEVEPSQTRGRIASVVTISSGIIGLVLLTIAILPSKSERVQIQPGGFSFAF